MSFNQPLYDEKLEKELIRRHKLYAKAKVDGDLQFSLMEACKADILFYFDTFAFTNKNNVFIGDKLPYAIPFLPFDYQREVIKGIWEGIKNKYSIFFEKSRQLGLTWLILEVFKYGLLFHGYKFHIISRTSDEVDNKGDINSCFGRLRFSLELTPSWILPKGFDKKEGSANNKYMNICRTDIPAAITGESANSNAGRGGTYDAIFLDEMAFMADAKAINRSCSQATSCRLINSTPNGESGEYYEMKKLAMDAKMEGYTLHWSLNPFYTKEWYAWKTHGMTDEQIQQELEISYTLSIAGRVYRKFQAKPIGVVDIGPQYEYNYILPFYCSIDNSHGGQDPNCCILFQITPEGKIQIFDCVQMNCNVTEMAHFLAKKPIHPLAGHELDFLDRYNKYKTPIFIADPNDTYSAMNDTTIMKEYRKVGIYLNTPNIVRGLQGNLVEQVRIATNMLDRIQVHERCIDYISAMQNARYPERKEGSQSTSDVLKPVHDHTSHYRTSHEYAMMWIKEQEENGSQIANTPIVKKYKIQVGDPVTGELVDKWIES